MYFSIHQYLTMIYLNVYALFLPFNIFSLLPATVSYYIINDLPNIKDEIP